MTACNFRSLLLAAIVLSNCITWTASRHHYAHNVHQHRTRHRRQGAGLYLPASYAIPGGEGSGPWGDWGEVSPCSRTCGGGVASQKRICLQPEDQSQCRGGDTKYFSCQTQDCPDGSGDFRAEQCAEFNDKLFRGFKYNWVPYTKAPNPCELNCMPHGERFYFRHKLQVTDGTRCNDESFDVCVNGRCQPVGCDMMLNSTAREDKCRECRGNGANCRTTDGLIDSQDLMKGYNDILLIPEGSTNINIEEIEPSNNYLALRAKNGTYYLNGHYHIDFPRTITIAGALWTYERSQQGFAAPDKLRCQGPINEPLYLSLLLQDDNVGISYEYSVPNNSAPPTDKRYNWVHEQFTPCSATCGGGFQNRNVTCRSREELEIVEDSLCDEGLKPPTNQSCNPEPCPPQWVEGPWGECSQRCGSGGVRSRDVTCQKIIANGQNSIVPDKECFDLLGPKPEVFQKCNEDAPCPTWFVGRWRPCDKLCDEGKQTREVTCYQKKDGRIKVLDDESCTEEKPEEDQPCMLQPCDGIDWVTTPWSGCDSCTSKNRTRLVVCSTKGQQILNESICSYHERPVDFEKCKPEELPACEVQWYATQWGKCSVNCGEGVQTRKVFCGMYYEDKTGDRVEIVADTECANLTKYKDTKPCTVPKEECPSQWFAGPWSECSEPCGGGEQYRTLMCFRGDKPSLECDPNIIIDPTQLCNTGPCNSVSSTVVMDDTEDEECVEDEVYNEVGLEFLTTNIMISDSPGYAEHESTLETGSGFGSSLSTDDLTTEGSGFSTTDTTDSDYTTDDETGSGETTFAPSTKAKDKDISTTTTVIPVTKGGESTETSTSDATASAETGSTESTVEETGSTDTEGTSPSDSTGSTESTGVTESTATADTDSTSSDTGSTSSEETGVTEASGPTTETESTDGSESTVVKETGSTSESGSTSSGETGSSDTDATGPTTEEGTGSTESSVSTESKEPTTTSESGSTSSGETVATATSDTGTMETTDSSASTVEETESTSETNSTSSGETTPTDETSSTDTDKTESTVSDGTDETSSTGVTESTVTETTGPTETTITKETSPTESTVTEKTSPTESTVTEETISTESTITEETGSTESTITDETGSTESTVTEETGSTESTVTGETGSTESTVTEETGSTESTVTEETGSTKSTVTEETLSTSTSESESTGAETTGTGSTEETSDTTAGSTDSTTTTKVPTDSTTTTRAIPTESKPPSTEESTTPLSTESSETTLSSTDSSESTIETSTSSGVESTGSESTSEQAGSSTVDSSTTSGSDETTEAGSTISDGSTTEGAESSSLGAETSTPSESESTTAGFESSSEASGSTGTESSTPSGTESTAETSESSSTVGSESTTEDSGSSTEESSTVSGEITTGTESTNDISTGSGSTTESTGTEESTDYSTTEGTTIGGSTEESESTVTGLSTTEGSTGTTIWSITTVVMPPSKVCKPRKPKCSKTKFGCCPDRKTVASGPFDEGCEKPHTCKESSHGCCPDGLSPAQGDNNEGCPVEPCADTLFGCCTSDNKTAAQGNDQDGCPPPPPACTTSKYRCCADNETEATGPEKEGCPETEISTTEAPTETTTETTKSIETSEGSTTNEGTTEVISTTTLDPCSSFEFGCCADNETEASGPDGQGCPCNATEYGCCPDGVLPASGLDNEGCPGPCSTSPHGCCQDGNTPAHGPEFEGCCLLQAFGCCPDNRKPAEGPHLEGCGCQYALHGCCPDNVTIAQGPDNQGCGCQYTEYGCCPDRHTAAPGPNNEGCTCNTYQFGCCADGVTTAKGPEQQGCHCRDSKFKCCGDGETPATGPDGAGCDCSSSQHGCCPDGRTEATGPKFLGCTDAPEDKQAACSMPTDQGPCHNFAAMWYYDLVYGGCSRFWYGGCDGNGNRFSTKEECEDVCVQPSPKDACKLPSVKGACDSDYQRWHYNSTREQCIPFRYGGCLGNANNFDTRELCQKQCEPSSVAGQCNLPIEEGSCAGNYSRWGFNSEAHRCEQFIWGGCEGNSNRFSSEAACQMRCAGTQPPQCTQPQEAGNCMEKEALWSFSQSENRCLPFYYSGCGGNDNRFSSREACEQTCPSAYVADKCTLPAETGQCSNYRERWFYDTTFKRCRQFYFGGCGGNENNFGTEAECENSCSEIKTTTTTTTTSTTARPVQKPTTVQTTPDRSEFCFNAIDAGPCNNTETRYAYDSELGRCVTFQYGGCGGNQNNFPDEDYCSYYCQPMQDVCQLPMLQGPCDDSLMRFFYDPTTDSCSQFTYGGCEGNDNRFESLEACENRCRTGPIPVSPTTPTTTVIVDGRPECIVPEALEDCRYGGVVWYFDQSRHECVSHANQEAGPVCRHTGTFSSQEACERSCGAFQGVDVCKQRLDAGPCQSYVTKVYFDQSTGQCHEFAYGGCLGGANRFSSIEECSQVCKSEIADPCTLPIEEGNCNLHVLQWYYDPSRDHCSQFVYTGCSGNDNRFETQRDCEIRCSKRSADTTTTTVVPITYPQPLAESECRTPSSLAPCGNNVTVFYYDSERRQCLVSGIGGCEHPNSYSSEEECERNCGAFRGLDVCGAHLDPGNCRASIPKYYWDAQTGTCQSYAYGGCAGGPNRFSSPEECMNVCGETGPDQNSILPPDCTPYRQQCESLNCQYGVDSFNENGCQRCICREDPCVRANCQLNERCEAFAVRDRATQEPVYSAKCVAETNEVYVDCDEYVANCSRLRCEYGVQRARLPDGCEKCSCVQVEIDCEPLREECNQLKCNYGIERIVGADGCERCKCKDYPCERKSCGEGERCVVNKYVDGLELEPQYTAECRTVVKTGACPMEETTTNEVTCRNECGDDADCRGIGKCCRRGCSDLCLLPVEQTSPHPLLTTTIPANVPAAPLALPQPEPEVQASEGGSVILRCLFHGNPPPKITWTFGKIFIDDNAGRYRLMSDGALEIVSLYRNDTGVYICVADNGLGVARQEINLVVNDPVRMPVGIAGDENAVVIGELGSPFEVRCLAYGYPPPSVFWYRGYNGAMVPYNDAVYLARGNILLIRSLAIETLGQYTCQAYNGEGKAASWGVFVRAYQPEEYFIENELLVPRNSSPARPRSQPPTTPETTTTTTTITTEAPRPFFTVPVSTHVSTPYSTLNAGTDLRLACDVDGFPEPDVHWTKDGATIQVDGRITITGSTIVSRLTVARVSVADSGLYTCHASNQYSSQSDTAQINVQQLVVPAKCTDNPFFADCSLIVRSKFCRHSYYSKFCCKSCVEAGQLDPHEAELQADQPYRKK